MTPCGSFLGHDVPPPIPMHKVNRCGLASESQGVISMQKATRILNTLTTLVHGFSCELRVSLSTLLLFLVGCAGMHLVIDEFAHPCA